MSTKALTVDWTRCDGHGLCARLFPERVALDEWGFPVVERGPISDEERSPARLAVRSCPRLAMRLE
jgi:ferredoxin